MSNVSIPPSKTCPNGHPIEDDDARFCPQCGGQLVEAQPPVPPPTPQHQQAPPPAAGSAPQPNALQPGVPPLVSQFTPQPQVRMCACGQLLPDEAQFCFHCGTKVASGHARFSLVCEIDEKPAGRADLDGQELVIGKTDECGLQIPQDNYVSRKHARLFLSDDKVFLEDLGSANGTYLKIRKPVPLEPGDEFLLGTTRLRLEENGT